jgi:hypothetical protein
MQSVSILKFHRFVRLREIIAPYLENRKGHSTIRQGVSEDILKVQPGGIFYYIIQ